MPEPEEKDRRESVDPAPFRNVARCFAIKPKEIHHVVIDAH